MKRVLGLLTLLSAFYVQALAVSESVVVNFNVQSGNQNNGAQPGNGDRLSVSYDGSILYGTTEFGGDSNNRGTAFSLDLNGTQTVLVRGFDQRTFLRTLGLSPNRPLPRHRKILHSFDKTVGESDATNMSRALTTDSFAEGLKPHHHRVRGHQ